MILRSILETRASVEVTINEQPITFYPASLSKMLKLKSAVKPISAAMATLWAKNASDTGVVVSSFKGAEDASTSEDMKPISVDLARHRATERASAISDVVELLMGDSNLDLLLDIIFDCMREKPTKDERAAFKEEVDVATLSELVLGCYEASKGVFAPLIQRVSETISSLRKREQPIPEAPGNSSDSQLTA